MPDLVVTSATLDLKPGAGWAWAATTGPPSVSIPASAASDSALNVGGLLAVLPRHLAALLASAPLSAPLGFDVPAGPPPPGTPAPAPAPPLGQGGTLQVTGIEVDQETLSAVLKQGGAGFLVKSTTGTFLASVVTPANNPSAVPVPPLAGVPLSGTWSISDAGEGVVATG